MAPLPRRFTRQLSHLKYAPDSTPPLGNPLPLNALPVIPLNSAFGDITSNATLTPSHLTPAPTSPTLNSIKKPSLIFLVFLGFLFFCICGRWSRYIWHVVNEGKDIDIGMDDHYNDGGQGQVDRDEDPQRRVSFPPVRPVVRLPLKTHKSPGRGLGKNHPTSSGNSNSRISWTPSLHPSKAARRSEKKKDPSHTPFSLPPKHLPPNPESVDHSPQKDTTPLVSHGRGGPLGATYPYGAITKSCYQISQLNSSTQFPYQSSSGISAASSFSASPLDLRASRSAPEAGGAETVGGELQPSRE
ncbi:hypothetical protein BGX38DRAFT_1207397 [Terfezia claveryi]|nr:hypothetical protein BGX38DRAFT_1207397 [Terfezia claveryi]